MRFRIHRLASREASTAFRWYLDRDPRAAARFRAALRGTMDRVRALPLSAPVRDQARHARVADFPYRIVYRLARDGDDLEVIAIAHDKRRPGYWRDR